MRSTICGPSLIFKRAWKVPTAHLRTSNGPDRYRRLGRESSVNSQPCRSPRNQGHGFSTVAGASRTQLMPSNRPSTNLGRRTLGHTFLYRSGWPWPHSGPPGRSRRPAEPNRITMTLCRGRRIAGPNGVAKRVVSYAVPMVRIHLPPAGSQQRTWTFAATETRRLAREGSDDPAVGSAVTASFRCRNRSITSDR